MNYYTHKNSQGSLNISENVYNQVAKDTLDELLSHDLQGMFSLKYGKKNAKITTLIDKKNHIQVQVEVFLTTGCDASKVTGQIQKAVYDSIYDITEISNVKVNVVVLSFTKEQKDEK